MPPSADHPATAQLCASLTGSALALAAGYVDALGFVALFGLFTSHVTGNFVLIGSELANPTHGVVIKLLAFPTFIAGVAVARLLVLYSEQSGRNAATLVLITQALLLSIFMVAGWLALPLEDSHSALALTAGMCGSAAMGIHNGASRLVWSSLSPTGAMSGNVTQLVIDLFDLLRSGGDPGLLQHLHKVLFPVIAFGFGAILGAFAFRYFSFFGLALPIAITAGLAHLSASGSLRPEESQIPP